jgi:hypothetical protein
MELRVEGPLGKVAWVFDGICCDKRPGRVDEKGLDHKWTSAGRCMVDYPKAPLCFLSFRSRLEL